LGYTKYFKNGICCSRNPHGHERALKEEEEVFAASLAFSI